MNHQYTPGPWEIVEITDPVMISTWQIKIGNNKIGFFPYVYQYADLSKTTGGYVINKEMLANASLIALAPDLLKALKLAVQQNSHDMMLTGDELRECQNLINKVIGEIL